MSPYLCETCGHDAPLSEPCRCEPEARVSAAADAVNGGRYLAVLDRLRDTREALIVAARERLMMMASDAESVHQFTEYRARLHRILARDPIDQGITGIELAQVRKNDLAKALKELDETHEVLVGCREDIAKKDQAIRDMAGQRDLAIEGLTTVRQQARRAVKECRRYKRQRDQARRQLGVADTLPGVERGPVRVSEGLKIGQRVTARIPLFAPPDLAIPVGTKGLIVRVMPGGETWADFAIDGWQRSGRTAQLPVTALEVEPASEQAAPLPMTNQDELVTTMDKPAGEPFRRGLPPEALRAVCVKWDAESTMDGSTRAATLTFFMGGIEQYSLSTWRNGSRSPVAGSTRWMEIYMRPSGLSWSEVEICAATRLGSLDGERKNNKRLPEVILAELGIEGESNYACVDAYGMAYFAAAQRAESGR